MAPTASKKPTAATARKAKTEKSAIKHVTLGLAPINGSQKPLRQASFPKFSIPTPSPSSSQEVLKKPAVTMKARPTLKGKEREVGIVEDAQLWVDKYVPTSTEELAVHKRKIQDVQRWLEEATTGGPSGKLKKYRRLLVLTGPAGAGKTATIRVLAKEMGLEIMEWEGAQEDPFRDDISDSLSLKFSLFLTHSTRNLSLLPIASATATASTSRAPAANKRLVLLEDLPNVLHPGTKEAFQAALEEVVAQPGAPPVVLIISDSGARGAEGWRREERWDIRSILPANLLSSPYVTEVQFNPVAPTIMHSALSRILTHTHPSSAEVRPSPETLDLIVESSMGDMRSAIMALQFACRIRVPGGTAGGGAVKGRGRRKKGKVGEEVRRIIEGITRNEQVLALFHILGKIFYNKRFGDDPEENEDPALEVTMRGVRPLPPHLSAFERRPSKVDSNTLYADSPVDISMLSLYCHQNYTQFCSEIEELADVMEWISYSEAFSLDSEHINMQLPEHAFHLLTLGTLVSLPSPVPRRGQKLLKSTFWEFNRKERDGIETLRSWSRHDPEAARDGKGAEKLERAWLLRRAGVSASAGLPGEALALGYMPWIPPIKGGTYGQELLVDGEPPEPEPEVPMSQAFKRGASDDDQNMQGEGEGGGWLEEDDIEDD